MPPKISSAEWDVMGVVWAKAPLTATEVFEALPPGHGWKQKTVNTFLTRLVEKGVLTADRQGKAFVYTARLAREDCVRVAGESFLRRVFQGATGDLVLHFCEKGDLTAEEIRELEQLLKSKKAKMSALDAIFRAVLDASWRASALVLVVLLLRPLLRGRLPARVMFWAWIAVAVRLLLPVTLPAAWSPFNLTPLIHAPISMGVIYLDTSNPLPAVDEATPLPATSTSPLPASITPARTRLTPLQWAAFVWAAGVAILLLARTWRHGRFLRRLRRSSAGATPALASLLAETAGRMGVRPLPVLVTGLVGAPALQGIVRPTLLLPPRFVEKLTPAEIQTIFAHELAHAQRHDLAHTFLHTAAILHWFNPLAWVAARTARHDCELACDAHVVRRLADSERELYGATLLKTIRLAHGLTPPPLGVGVAEFKQQIKRRLHMIVAHQSSRPALTLLTGALFLLTTGLSLTRELHAQPSPAVSAPPPATPPRTLAAPTGVTASFPDTLDQLFPNGIVATVGDRSITVEDVRREMSPLKYTIKQGLGAEELKSTLRELQNHVITTLIRRILLIKEFPTHGPSGGSFISEGSIDANLAEALKTQFGDDRTKLLDHLRSRNMTMSDYRKSIEEEIIYRYMIQKEVPVRRPLQPASQEGKTHLRLIQLSRAEGETDAALLTKANTILARLKAGEKFEDLAKELSDDKRAAKGGDWGWLGAPDLRADYREAFVTLKKGDVSAPIIAKEGAFLLYAEDRK